ncbi:MAG: tyrosine recombinase [Fimbriimonadales bacterium]
MHSSQEIDNQIAWFLDHLQGERGASPHTVTAYERDLRQISELYRGSDWTKFGNVDAAAVRSAFGARGLSPSTIQRKTAALRSLLKFLSSRSKAPIDGLPSMKGLRKAKALPKALSIEEMERLLARPDLTTPPGLRDRAMIELLYGGGLRVTELVELRMEHYVESESLLRIFGKRGKTRMIPIPAGTHEWLRKYLAEGRPKLLRKPSPEVFVNQRGSRLSRSGVFRILAAYARAAGIETLISPHTLRHTYAVHLVQAGADLRSVQELLGHASVATTEVYTHLDMETVKRKYDAAHPRARK